MADVYEGKSLPDLFKDILNHAAQKRNTINTIMNELRQYVTSADDAAVFAPIVKDFLDVSVRNDDSLVKVATIVQRLSQNEGEGKGGVADLLSDSEKELLMQELAASASKAEIQQLTEKVKTIITQDPDV